MMGVAATMAAAPASADVTIGKAKPISEADLRAKVTPAAEKILRGNGATNIEGAKALKEAIAEIATNGPQSIRALAAEVGRLIPNDRLMLTVNDKRLVNAHGVVELHPLPHMTLFTAEGRTGLSNSTVLHEALHAAVMARYHTLGTAVIRSNDAKLKMDAPAAAAALEQFRSLWDEFREASRYEKPASEDLALSIQQARSDPDEFFVRALTDPRLQGWMSAKQYEGKTLMEKFKDWIKSALFGFVKSGTAPSWLDAALLATSELNAAMLKDNPDFKRLSAINDFRSKREAMFSRAEPADATDMRSAPVVRQIQQRAHDLLATRRTFNWWHRTVGTQFHKAQVDADFGRVYTAAQDYLHDTSAFANDSADLAPDLLPQLKSIGDLKKTLGLNKRESKDMVEAFFEIVHGTLVAGQDVKLSGFGNFNIRRKAPRPGRNPRTGESIPIKARNVVTFHASHKLKSVVQGDTPAEDEFE